MIEDFLENIFIQKLKLFEKIYVGFAEKAKNDHCALIFLKASLEMQYRYAKNYNEKEKKLFEEYIERMLNIFNPDTSLKLLQNSLLCISFSDSSFLSEKYGTDLICGKYLGLINNMKAKIKSKETGEYEMKESNLSFNFGFPTPNDIITVSYLDLRQMTDY